MIINGENNLLNSFSRLELLIGEEGVARLKQCRVAVFGVGGVGGYVVEALVRSAIGALDIIDNDEVALTNLNRQIFATQKTLGLAKVDAAKERALSINPAIQITKHKTFFLPDTADAFDFSSYDYVVDAVDTVAAKIELAVKCKEAGIPLISSMGCGNRMDPTRLRITDITKTHMDPLAKVMRHELKKRGIHKLTVLFSEEPPLVPYPSEESTGNQLQKGGTDMPKAEGEFFADGQKGKRQTPGSNAFVPPAAGLAIASYVVKELSGFSPKGRTKGGAQ